MMGYRVDVVDPVGSAHLHNGPMSDVRTELLKAFSPRSSRANHRYSDFPNMMNRASAFVQNMMLWIMSFLLRDRRVVIRS